MAAVAEVYGPVCTIRTQTELPSSSWRFGMGVWKAFLRWGRQWGEGMEASALDRGKGGRFREQRERQEFNDDSGCSFRCRHSFAPYQITKLQTPLICGRRVSNLWCTLIP